MKKLKINRILISTICAVLGFVVLYFVLVLGGGLIKVNPVIVKSEFGEKSDDKAEVVFYLDNNGRHYDIWIPAQYCDFLSDVSEDKTDNGWYGFGWGDRDFFLNTPYASDVNIGILFKALFLPSRSVLAVQYSNQSPAKRPTVLSVPVDDARIENAVDYIESWFDTGSNGLLRIPMKYIHPSYNGYSFFESHGKYSLFFTSNNWVNEVLKVADVPTALWTPLTFGLYQ